MRVYKDVLEKSNIGEVIEKFRSYSIVNIVDEEVDEEGLYLYIEFSKEILAYDNEENEYVQTEAWTICEGEKFEFYPDDLRLIVEEKGQPDVKTV